MQRGSILDLFILYLSRAGNHERSALHTFSYSITPCCTFTLCLTNTWQAFLPCGPLGTLKGWVFWRFFSSRQQLVLGVLLPFVGERTSKPQFILTLTFGSVWRKSVGKLLNYPENNKLIQFRRWCKIKYKHRADVCEGMICNLGGCYRNVKTGLATAICFRFFLPSLPKLPWTKQQRTLEKDICKNKSVQLDGSQNMSLFLCAQVHNRTLNLIFLKLNCTIKKEIERSFMLDSAHVHSWIVFFTNNVFSKILLCITEISAGRPAFLSTKQFCRLREMEVDKDTWHSRYSRCYGILLSLEHICQISLTLWKSNVPYDSTSMAY